MKRFRNTRILMPTIFLLLAALPAAAVERPFACNGNGVAVFVTDGAGHITGASLTASGTATYLGMWTAVGTLQFAPDPNNPTNIVPSGAATFTAADGDNLEVVIADGRLDVTTGIAQGVFRFVGGTGRFSAVSGSTNIVVSQNLVTGAFQLTAVGSIDF